MSKKSHKQNQQPAKKSFSDQILERNQVLIRSLIFVAVSVLFNVLRQFITYKMWGYKVFYADGFSRFALLGFVPLFWYTCWGRIKNEKYNSESGFVMVMYAVAALFFELCSVKWLNGISPRAMQIGEVIIGFLRELILLFMYMGRPFLNKFKYEFLLMTGVIIPLAAAQIVTEYYWEYSSAVTFIALKVLVPLTHLPYTMNPEHFTLSIKDFAVTIGASCAGLQSLTAFTALFALAVILLRKNGAVINVTKSIFFYLGGFVLVYITNSIRVLAILLVGALYDKNFAINSFHSSIGAVLFLFFFVLYIGYCIPRMSSRRVQKTAD